jgi:hypothetical protein
VTANAAPFIFCQAARVSFRYVRTPKVPRTGQEITDCHKIQCGFSALALRTRLNRFDRPERLSV